MAELNVQQQNIIKQLKQAYPELKNYPDEQILSLYNQQLNNIQLSEDKRISIMNGRNGISNDGMGLRLEGTQTSVSKEQETQLKSALTARLNAVSTNIKKAEDSNGFLGSMWSGFKNLTGIGDSSDKVREQQKADLKALESGNIAEAFKQITGLDYTIENVNKFLNNEIQTKSETALNGYTEGQDMASDITADIISGIAAVGIYTAAVAAAPFTGGASIVVGVAAAGASAAAIKTGIKYADAKSGGREYTADNLKKDLATGAFSGVLAPITGGMGGAVGKTVAVKTFGIQAVKQVGKEVAEEAVEETAKGFVKTALTNPYGYEYIGGNVLKRAGAYSAEMITDGAVSGFFDSAFRTAYDGGSLEEVGEAAVMGGVSGGAGAWLMGGGIKVFGRGMQKIFGKNDVKLVEYCTEDGITVVRTSPIKKQLPDFIESKKDLPFKESDIDATVDNFINHYSKQANGFREGLEYSGFTKLGIFLSRVKGKSSLRDKIKNYLKDNPKANYLDIWKEVRDCFGARTIIDNLNYKDYPEVVDMVNKGDLDGAKRRMAEIQTEPFVQQFKNFIDQNANGENKITTARISNYVSDDGIPYLSEAQLADMKDYAMKRGVELEIFEKISKDDPKYAEMKATGYKSTIKAQPSGYTALQINFKNANGDVMEWQFRGKLVNEFAEAEHLPYDLRTSKDVIGAHPELEPLYNPLKELLSKDKMPDDVYKQYNKYLTAHYKHLRNLELGFESTPPKLSDFEINGFKFDPRLEADNLIKLSEMADKLKKGEITQDEAVKNYNYQIKKSIINSKFNKPHPVDIGAQRRDVLRQKNIPEEIIDDVVNYREETYCRFLEMYELGFKTEAIFEIILSDTKTYNRAK